MSNASMGEIVYHEQKEFRDVSFVDRLLRNREFHECRFIDCNFTGSDLKTNLFQDCIFERCNLSMMKIEEVGFQNVKFVDCKILGVDFSVSSKFALSLSFEACSLDYSVFFGLKLPRLKCINCLLREVDFTQSDLTSSDFSGSDLSGAHFFNSILEKANFRTAKNFSIDPAQNKVKGAKFLSYQLGSLLHKYQLEIE